MPKGGDWNVIICVALLACSFKKCYEKKDTILYMYLFDHSLDTMLSLYVTVAGLKLNLSSK